MIPDLEDYEGSDSIVRVKYSKIRDFLAVRNIKMKKFEKIDGGMTISGSVALEGNAVFFPETSHLCSMGAFSYSHASELTYGVKIGRYCSIAKNVSVMGATHFVDWISTSPKFYRNGYHELKQRETTHHARTRRKINIGNDVWIGANVVLKSEVNIGDGVVIASNSVVTRDLKPFGIYAGVPAKLIRMRFSDDIIEQIEKLKWWRYSIDDLAGLTANDPAVFVRKLGERLAKGSIKEFNPPIVRLSDLPIDE
jgi:virginiamycin A acetyltransferase